MCEQFENLKREKKVKDNNRKRKKGRNLLIKHHQTYVSLERSNDKIDIRI